MPFLRLTRDQRGYENTFLLHVNRLGESPRILYWYRSAPGVRVGRPALDEDAIRTIEEQHPDIEFDWPHIFAIGAAMTPEIERRPDRGAQRGSAEEPERARRMPARPREPAIVGLVVDNIPPPSELVSPAETDQSVAGTTEPLPQPAADRPELLSELVGREIAMRLRARYVEIRTRLQAVPDATRRAEWQARVEALNPDAWGTPEEILHGIQHADALFDEIRRGIG